MDQFSNFQKFYYLYFMNVRHRTNLAIKLIFVPIFYLSIFKIIEIFSKDKLDMHYSLGYFLFLYATIVWVYFDARIGMLLSSFLFILMLIFRRSNYMKYYNYPSIFSYSLLLSSFLVLKLSQRYYEAKPVKLPIFLLFIEPFMLTASILYNMNGYRESELDEVTLGLLAHMKADRDRENEEKKQN